MYIEFDLRPKVHLAPRPAAGAALRIIQNEMQAWSHRYSIAFRDKTIKSKHRVTFDQDQNYSFWAMTWNPEQIETLAQYRIVSDLNNKI